MEAAALTQDEVDVASYRETPLYIQLQEHNRDRVEGSLSRETFELKKINKGLTRTNPSPKTTLLMYKSACNSRKSLGDDFLRASVVAVAVAVAQMTTKVFKYWRERRDLFPRLSRSLPLPSSRKRDLLKVANNCLTTSWFLCHRLLSKVRTKIS